MKLCLASGGEGVGEHGHSLGSSSCTALGLGLGLELLGQVELVVFNQALPTASRAPCREGDKIMPPPISTLSPLSINDSKQRHLVLTSGAANDRPPAGRFGSIDGALQILQFLFHQPARPRWASGIRFTPAVEAWARWAAPKKASFHIKTRPGGQLGGEGPGSVLLFLSEEAARLQQQHIAIGPGPATLASDVQADAALSVLSTGLAQQLTEAGRHRASAASRLHSPDPWAAEMGGQNHAAGPFGSERVDRWKRGRGSLVSSADRPRVRQRKR